MVVLKITLPFSSNSPILDSLLGLDESAEIKIINVNNKKHLEVTCQLDREGLSKFLMEFMSRRIKVSKVECIDIYLV